MSIPFIQYIRPNGLKRPTSIDRPADIEKKAYDLISIGIKFEIEELTTGQVSMDASFPDSDYPLAGRICNNGPEVSEHVDSMVNECYEVMQLKGYFRLPVK